MILPVVAGIVLLGTAFDFNSLSATNYTIYNMKDINENIQVIPQTCSQKQYHVIKSATDFNRGLGLHPGISLKAKEGNVTLPGLTGFLKTVVDRNSTVEIVLVVEFETETLSFPSRSLPVVKEWQDKPQSEVGSHFVSSTTSGGRLVVSMRLRPTEPKHLKDVEKAVADRIGQHSGAIDELFFRQLDSLISHVHRIAAVEYTTLTTVRGVPHPTNLLEVRNIVETFEDIVRRDEEFKGKGPLLKFELTDLNRIQSNFSRFEENLELEPILEEANEKHEDLRMAERRLKEWLATEPTMKEKEEEMVTIFTEKLNNSMNALTNAICRMTFDGKTDQFAEAFSTYEKITLNMPYRYTYVLNECITLIDSKTFFGRWWILFMKWMGLKTSADILP